MTPEPSPDEPTLVSIELVRVQLPLRHAHRAAHGTEAVRDLILVGAAFDDGTVGWGECSALARPTYTSEHTAGAWLVLRDEVAPAVFAGRAPQVVGHPMASAAVLTALTDAVLKRAERSLATELAAAHGTNPLTAVPTAAVISERTWPTRSCSPPSRSCRATRCSTSRRPTIPPSAISSEPG